MVLEVLHSDMLFLQSSRGYLADSISADIYCGSYPSVVSMNNVMSKFLNIGMTLEDVIRRTTVNPAHIISHPELGTLSVESAADIAVLELQQGDFGYYDSQRGKIRRDKRLQAMMTLLGGQVIFDLNAMDKTIWEDIPKDDRYWKNSNDQTW